MHPVNPEVMTSGQWLLEGKCPESSGDEPRADPRDHLTLTETSQTTPDQFTQLPSRRKIITIMNLPHEVC